MDNWEKDLSCAESCGGCDKKFEKDDRRILSVYHHGIICMDCKAKEEKKPDYEDVSKSMIARCIEETDRPYGDPGGYCFHHFCPYKC